MRRMLAAAILVAGCSSSMPPDPKMGGSLTLDAPCGYMVTTVNDASRPLISKDHTLGADPTPKFVHLTVPHDARTGVAVLWRTNDEKTMATQVQFGAGASLDQTVEGISFVYDPDPNTEIRMHETHLCGLQPDTQYSYRVGGGPSGKEVWSPTYTFRTAPDRASAPDAQVQLLVIGDTRDKASVWRQALETAMQKGPPDFILFSGDATLLGDEQTLWDAWFMAADPLLASTPMLLAHGNHEANSVAFYSQFALPGDETNYGADLGPVHLSVANDTPLDSAAVMGANAQTLSQHVQDGTSAPWNLVMHHKPVFSACQETRHPNDYQPQQMYWQPIYDQYKVDMVFNGHDHDYERSKPMRGMTVGATPADGTTYVTVGTAGANLDPNGTKFFTAYSEMTYSFSIVTARKGMLTLNAFRPDGSSIETFTATK